MIRRAAALFDEVIVGGRQPLGAQGGDAVLGRGAPASSSSDAHRRPAERARRAFNTLVVEFARSVGAKAIVKGLRAISDFEYELEMNQLNRRQAPEIESVYLMASPQYSFLSSSGVKELATFGGEIDDLVPDEVSAALEGRAER